MSGEIWIRIGAVFGGLAVAAGAFGAHSLRPKMEPRLLEIFETAARYQAIHALALIATGLVALRSPRCGALKMSGSLFTAGIILFCGSLYGLAFSGPGWLGPLTPIGGGFLVMGWILLAIHSSPSREISAAAGETSGTH